jgi:hypothetical protein
LKIFKRDKPEMRAALAFRISRKENKFGNSIDEKISQQQKSMT